MRTAVKNVDFNASKAFPIFERMNLQLRPEFFNLLNRTNYSTPDNGVQDAQIGQILSAASPGCEVQFALKSNASVVRDAKKPRQQRTSVVELGSFRYASNSAS